MTERLEFANSLRGIAALAVVAAHYCGVFWFARPEAGAFANAVIPADAPTPWLAHWLTLAFPINWGAFGVALFFLISGFVIPFSFARSNALGFLIGRFFRIYPLYMAGFSVTLAALALTGHAFGIPFGHEASDVAIHYIPGLRDIAGVPQIDNIVWSLEIELHFYLVCALSAPLLRAGALLVFAVPAALLVLAATATGLIAFDSQYLLFMFIGVAFNLWHRKAISAITLFGVAASILFACVKVFSITMAPQIVHSYVTAFVVFSTCAAVSRWWPRLRVLSFFADISYPLYVTHPVMGYGLMAILLAHGVPVAVALACAFAAAISVAWLLHVLVEMPTHRIGQRLAQAFRRAPVTSLPKTA